MKKAILATKVGMTQIFNEDGTLVPVTVLQAGPCAVTQIKTVENDGYKCSYSGCGHVASQNPAPGTAMKEGGTVTLKLE